jgi:chemotaxis protein MotB
MKARAQRNRLRTGNEGWLTSYADLMTNLLIFFVLIVSASEIQTGRMERLMSRISGTPAGSLAEAQQVLEKTIHDQKLDGQVRVDITDSGLELSFNSGVTFASGQAAIRTEFQETLTKVLSPLIPLADKYRFAIEGHTDPTPMSGGSAYKSNWELASARSNEVRDRLEKLGVPKQRIRTEGYADTKPLPPEQLQGLSNEEALARHRRVVVRLY